MIFDDVSEFIGDGRLAFAEDTQFARIQFVSAELFQIRHDVILKHGKEFPRRPGEEDCGLVLRGHDAAGRCAKGVWQDDCALGETCLFEIVGGEHIAARFKMLGESLDFFGNRLNGEPQRGGDGLLGEVVVRRSKATGEDDHIRTFHSLMDDRGEPLDIVAHGGVIKHLKPERGQPLGDKLRVGIDDLPHQQFCADGDNFCNHDCVTSLF
ncbi:hypothetical protein SDC9_113846 [bioreactor metagenome]|uniref:Uncharacterized protein n=1 Tax=bioreactor metagenome TaxID=1076179 RepID=A0A645BP25_9ZZZZ